MDNLPTTQLSPQPQVYISSPPFYKSKRFIILLFVVLLITIPLVAFLYSRFQQTAAPTSGQGERVIQPVLDLQDFSFKADNLSFPCPLTDNASCSSQTLLTLNSGQAVGYKGASGSAILNAVEVKSAEDMAVFNNKPIGKKYFFESVESGDNSCFVVIYTFPSDAVFGNTFSIPSKKLATLGEKTIQIVGREVNVIIQVKSAPKNLGKDCSLTDKNPEFFTAD